MSNKIIVTIIVPTLEESYDILIPVNKRVHSIITNIKKSLYELSAGSFDISREYSLYDKNTGEAYDINKLIRDTDIVNDSKLILL